MTCKEIVESYLKGITAACGLGVNEAKTIIYYSIATYGMQEIQLMPVLILRGPQGTGKSTIMKILVKMVNTPILIDGKVTSAVLRDRLKYGTTALIEEADKVDEQLLIKRYSTQTSSTIVKRGGTMQGFKDEQINIFGATVLHRRVPFKDAALDSRSIIITTRYNPGVYEAQLPESNDGLRQIANSVQWDKILGLPVGRVTDVWRPLFQVALICDDSEWVAYAVDQLMRSNERFKSGHTYEPEAALIQSLEALFYQGGSLTPEPIDIKEIKRHLKENSDIHLYNYQIEQMAENLNFIVVNHHGIHKVQPNSQLLQELFSKSM